MRSRADITVLNRLARENKRMGQRLAELEFRDMMADLDNPGLFDLQIDFGQDMPPAEPFWPEAAAIPRSRRLSKLDVPLGRITWLEDVKSLPVVAIYVPDARDAWAAKFRSLMKQHATQPFARLVFLCANQRPVPFLGRYGFAYEYVGSLPIDRIYERVSARFGVSQIRDLVSGNKLWPR